MCDGCGCDQLRKPGGAGQAVPTDAHGQHEHWHVHADGTAHSHAHGHGNALQPAQHSHSHGEQAAAPTTPGAPASKDAVPGN